MVCPSQGDGQISQLCPENGLNPERLSGLELGRMQMQSAERRSVTANTHTMTYDGKRSLKLLLVASKSWDKILRSLTKKFEAGLHGGG